MTTRAARAVRGASFAALAVLLAAVAHTLAGGGAPTPLFCAIAAVLATPGAMLLAGPRVRAWRTIAAVAGSQLVFHLALTLMGDLGRWDAGVSEHVHGTGILFASAAPADPLVAGGAGSAAMVLLHSAAALITAILVFRGERALVAVWKWATARLLPARSLPLPAAYPPAPAPVARRAAVVRPRVAAEPLTRRGPPLFAAA